MVVAKGSVEDGNTVDSLLRLQFYVFSLEHRHPFQIELEIRCRVVQFSLELPHPSAKRMNLTTLHPIFSECPAKLSCFAVDKLPELQ